MPFYLASFVLCCVVMYCEVVSCGAMCHVLYCIIVLICDELLFVIKVSRFVMRCHCVQCVAMHSVVLLCVLLSDGLHCRISCRLCCDVLLCLLRSDLR